MFYLGDDDGEHSYTEGGLIHHAPCQSRVLGTAEAAYALDSQLALM